MYWLVFHLEAESPILLTTPCTASLQLGTRMEETDNNTQTHSAEAANFSTFWKTPADEFFQ
jgi:hypothetical protein